MDIVIFYFILQNWSLQYLNRFIITPKFILIYLFSIIFIFLLYFLFLYNLWPRKVVILYLLISIVEINIIFFNLSYSSSFFIKIIMCINYFLHIILYITISIKKSSFSIKFTIILNTVLFIILFFTVTLFLYVKIFSWLLNWKY